MILVKDLINNLKKNNISFFTGVPDSILKDFCNYLTKLPKKQHIIAANEGSAISLGIGYYLSKKKIACVYLQNAGLSNAINPLISIAHKKIYSIPLLLIIGWRGSPKKNDEPQHILKGKITKNLLKLLNIPFFILRKKKDLIKMNRLIKFSNRTKNAVACLIEKDTLKDQKKLIYKQKVQFFPLRRHLILELLKQISKNTKIISTTGYTSRELMQIRSENNLSNGKDFYMIGGMGHSSMVSLGYSLKSKKQIICLDGDGSLLMHMGSLRTIGFFANSNFKHILLNNNSHESVGGQTTHAGKINFNKLTKSLGYKNFFKISKVEKIKFIIKKFLKSKGPSFLEVRISEGTMNNLPRPKNLIKIKKQFMN